MMSSLVQSCLGIDSKHLYLVSDLWGEVFHLSALHGVETVFSDFCFPEYRTLSEFSTPELDCQLISFVDSSYQFGISLLFSVF